jgi:WXG100 family type VII secretion target
MSPFDLTYTERLMPNISQLNYEEASSIAKNIHNDGDDLVQLHSQTRQRVHALRSEWIGEAADAFFEEMESELLPAMQRVSGALFLGEEILNKIMKIIHEADEETAQYFKSDLDGDFGAGLFGSALGGVLGEVVGGDDFGASKFEEALPTEGENPPTAGQGDSSQAGGTTADSATPPVQLYMDKENPSADTASTETPPAETETAATGGGGSGGGGDSSQGMQGDLKGLGSGVGGTAQQISSAAGGQPGMPDHVYEGSSGGSSGAALSQPGPASGSGGPGEQSSGGVAGAVGAAGVLGAAAAGAAKVLKNDHNEPDE